MRYLTALSFVVLIAFACKQKVLSGPELEDKLIKTMQAYLDKEAHPGVKYKVKDVNYFADKDKKLYNCEFHVNMKVQNVDTTGLMTANIPNDFSNVERKQ